MTYLRSLCHLRQTRLDTLLLPNHLQGNLPSGVESEQIGFRQIEQISLATTQSPERSLWAGLDPVRQQLLSDEPNRPVENDSNITESVISKTSYSWYNKLGWLAFTILAVGCIFILGPLAFLSFLWFGNWTNPTWHSIVVRDWLTRSTTLSALVLRTAISLQASVTTSMLAV